MAKKRKKSSMPKMPMMKAPAPNRSGKTMEFAGAKKTRRKRTEGYAL